MCLCCCCGGCGNSGSRVLHLVCIDCRQILGCITVTEIFFVTDSPSPAAVTAKLEVPGTARADAVNVSITVLVLLPAIDEIGLTDQSTVSPVAAPSTVMFTSPANAPPVAAEKLTTANPPCTRETELELAVSVSTAGWVALLSQLSANAAASTDPSPVAWLKAAPPA